jgi:hypothetical protein
MYLCPLGILVVFAVGVLGLSIVLPRIQERRQEQESYTMTARGAGFDGEGEGPSLFGEVSTHDTSRSEGQIISGKGRAPGRRKE